MSSPNVAADSLDAPPPVEGGTISGQVTDFQGLPMVGVRVEAAETGGADLDLLPTLSNGHGAFMVEGLADDARYDLRFSLGTVKARVLAVPTGTDQLQVKLARPQGILLHVKTEGGRPPPDLSYVVLERDASPRPIREYYGRTLRARLLLWSIRPGRYTVKVWGGPYLPVEAHGVQVTEGDPAPECEILLGPVGGTIGGEITDADGNPSPALVSWRRVDAMGHAPLHLTSVSSDPEGNFLFRGLPAGRYHVSAWSERNGVGTTAVDVAEQQSTSVTVRLR